MGAKTGAVGALRPRLNYTTFVKLEPFYTGGPARVSADRQWLACACGGDVKIVDMQSGAVVRTLAGDGESVTALAWGCNNQAAGPSLYVCSRSLQQRCWRASTGELLRSWKAHRAPVLDLALDSSGGLLASGSADGSARVWDMDGGYCTHSFTQHKGVVLRVLFHPRELLLITSTDEAEVVVWDLVDKSRRYSLEGHFSAVTAIDLSPDGWTLVSGGRDKVVIVWDVRTGCKLATLPVYEALEGVALVPPNSGLPGVGSSDGGKALYFATAGEKGCVRLWRSDTGRCVHTQQDEATIAHGSEDDGRGGLADVQLLRNPLGLLAATGDARLLVYESQGIARSDTLRLSRQLIGNCDEVTDVRLVGSVQGRHHTHVAVATNSERIHVFELATLSCCTTLAGHSGAVVGLDAAPLPSTSAAGSAGGTLLASGSKDNSVRLWQLPKGRCLAVGEGHLSTVTSVAFSRRSPALLVSAGEDKILKVWDSGAVLAHCDAAEDEGGGPRPLTATAAVAAHDKMINAVAVSPNDALVATCSLDRTARVWRLPALVQALTLRGHKRGVSDVAFSTVDQVLATASADKTLRLWALHDGSCLRSFEGHASSALRVAFVTAGTQLLSGGADGCMKLWGLRSGECANTIECHEDKVWGLHAALGGDAVATGGGDGRVVVWQDCTAQDAAAAAAEEESLVLREQQLAGALQAEDFLSAARIAFDLQHPGRLLSVLQRITSAQPLPEAGAAVALGAQAEPEVQGRVLSGLVAGARGEQLRQWLIYVRDWNTNTRSCHTAQVLLQSLLRTTPPEALLELPGASELLEGIAAYSYRHYARTERLQRSAALVDYLLAAASVLSPDEAAEEGQRQGAQQRHVATGEAAGAAPQANGGSAPAMNGHHSEVGNGNALAYSDSSSSGDEGFGMPRGASRRNAITR